MRTLKRSDLPGEIGIPLYVIPSRSPIAHIIDSSFFNLTITLGSGIDQCLYVFHIDADHMVLDADDREELSMYRVKYHPTPDEVVTALTGPMGPAGPQGATGMKGDSA